MGPQAGIGWCFRLGARLTEIFRPCDLEFFNRSGRIWPLVMRYLSDRSHGLVQPRFRFRRSAIAFSNSQRDLGDSAENSSGVGEVRSRNELLPRTSRPNSKSVVRLAAPWVRIPPSPPDQSVTSVPTLPKNRQASTSFYNSARSALRRSARSVDESMVSKSDASACQQSRNLPHAHAGVRKATSLPTKSSDLSDDSSRPRMTDKSGAG